jgi:hypothetical protein
MAELEEQPHGGALYRPSKGETANPNGRPKGVKSFKRILKELLKENTTITDITGEIKSLSKKEAGILLLVRDATNEDEDPNVRMKALNMVMEKIDGKAVAKADINHRGNVSNTPDFSKLSDAELDAYLALCQKLNGGE